jgi:transposase
LTQLGREKRALAATRKQYAYRIPCCGHSLDHWWLPLRSRLRKPRPWPEGTLLPAFDAIWKRRPAATWSEEEKLKIVLESLQAPRQVAATARRYGVSRSLLLRWRRLFGPEPTEAPAGRTGFVPAMVVAGSGAASGPVGSAGTGAIEIEFAAGTRMRITGTVDAAMLKAAVAALADGQR